MSTSMRFGTAADADTAGALLHAFATEFDSATEGAGTMSRRLRSIADREDVLLVLAGEVGAQIGVGVVVLRPTFFADGLAALLEELYVVPERRGQGVGSDLLRFTIEQVRARGADVFEIPWTKATATPGGSTSATGSRTSPPRTATNGCSTTSELSVSPRPEK